MYIIRKRVLLTTNHKDRVLSDDKTVSHEDGNVAYAYLGRDINMQHLESSKAFSTAEGKGISNAELHEMRKRQGFFIPQDR